jgi:GGDEF domain-containing protein
MSGNRREIGKTRLPLWAAGFVALACAAILALSGWREWESAADRALYAAKNGGRDRLMMAGQVFAWLEAKSA